MANLSTAVVQSMRPRFALKWIVIAVLIILGFVGLNYASRQLAWEPIIYARIVGVALAVLAGLIVLVKVPARWQALFAGSALGISVDEISNGTPNGSNAPGGTSPASLLASLSKYVKGLSDALIAYWPDGPVPTEATVIAGVWAFVLTLGLIMLLGTLQGDAI